MAEEKIPAALGEEEEGYEPDLITLEDEEGNEHTFEVIDALTWQDVHYMALVPWIEDEAQMAEADLELVIMKVGSDDEGEYMDVVEDDEEFLAVSKQFEERLNEMYDIQ